MKAIRKFESGNRYLIKPIAMKSVDSELIEMIGYDEEDRLLYVALKLRNEVERPLMIYEGVRKNFYDAFMNADSKDEFFNEKIKDSFGCFNDVYYSPD